MSLFTFFFGLQSAIPKKELLRLLDADGFQIAVRRNTFCLHKGTQQGRFAQARTAAEMFQREMFGIVLPDKGTDRFHFLRAGRCAVCGGLAAAFQQCGKQVEQQFFFLKTGIAPQHQFVQRAQAVGQCIVLQDVLCKAWQDAAPGEFFSKGEHGVLRNVEGPIGKGAAVGLCAAVAVAGVEQQKITRAQVVLPVFAAEGALALLDQAQHIVRMEVVREGLHDARKAVGFQMQLCIVHHSAQFVGVHGAVTSFQMPLYRPGDRMSCKISSFRKNRHKKAPAMKHHRCFSKNHPNRGVLTPR